MTNLWRDRKGSTLVEFTIVFPIFILIAFCLVDVSYMLYDWALANKATYAGAHRAIVSDPIAAEISSPPWDPTKMGVWCYDGTNTVCPNVTITCTPTATSGSCQSGATPYTWVESAFDTVLSAMQRLDPAIQRTNVTIVYSFNDLGFDGQPSGLPVNVTIGTQCMVHTFYFMGALMKWVFPSVCGNQASGWVIPAYATILTSEDLTTN